MKSPQTLLGILSVLVLAGGIVFFLFKHRKHTYTRFKELIKTVGALKKQLNQQTEKLEIALVKAEEANRLKSLFLANMSHEIRTPLNGIVGFSELMADEGFNLEQKREFACQIEQNSRHLLQIMDQIFHLSIIETGNVKIYREPFPIQSFLSSVSRQFKNKVEHSGKAIRFVLTRPEENLQVITDKQKLHLIIENLLDNALKFTDRGSIELGFIKEEQDYLFSISDTGCGIGDDEFDIIFDPFIQGRETLRKIKGGSGLSLSNVKSYLIMLGGKIWCEKNYPHGLIFYFTIPCHEKSSVHTLGSLYFVQN